MSLQKREIVRGEEPIDDLTDLDVPESPTADVQDEKEESMVKRHLKREKLKKDSPYGKIFRKAVKNRRLFK
jgi:hypothetical protein